MVIRILLSLLFLLVLPSWALYRLLGGRLWPKRWRRLWFLPNGLLLATCLALLLFRDYGAGGQVLLGRVIVAVVALGLSQLVMTLFLLLGRALRWRPWRLACLGLGFSAVLGMLYVLVEGTTHSVTRTEVVRTEVAVDGLPRSFDGYRIVQLSDVHLGTYGGQEDFVQNLVDSVNRLQADAVVFTGDLVNFCSDEVAPFAPVLRQLRGRDGVFAVMGNHDYMSYRAWPDDAARLADIAKLQTLERGMGWNLLLNDRIWLRRGADSLALIGVENDGRPPFPQYADLPKAMAGLSPGDGVTKILLSHDPTHWRRAIVGRTDIALTLSGHTHGGQFSLLGWQPIQALYDEWAGLYREGRQQLYVSTGVGEALLPFRFGMPPHVELITLRAAD